MRTLALIISEESEMDFAFLIMSDGKTDSAKEMASICSGQFTIANVNDIEDARKVAAEMERKGVGCIELCGAFGQEGCKAVIEATGGRIPVGYVIHLPQQDELFKKAFS